MQNIHMSLDKQKTELIIKIDLTKEIGPSKSGKTTIIGTTSGNKHVIGDIFLGVNCYKKK